MELNKRPGFRNRVKAIAGLPLIKNFMVLLVDRGSQLLIQLFNIFILTKYLGPEKFGVLIYALSLYGLVLTLSNLGLERVLVIELTKVSDNYTGTNNILFTGILIKLLVSTILYVVLLVCASVFTSFISPEVYSILTILSVNVFFSFWMIVDAYNQSIGGFRFTAFSRIVSAVAIIVVRACMVYYGVSFKWIVFSFIVEQVICLAVCLVLSRKFLGHFKAIFSFRLKVNFTPSILKSGIYIVCSTVCIILYFRFSQGIVEQRFNKLYLGMYSLVIYLIEVPISLSSIMSTVFTPQLTRNIDEHSGSAVSPLASRVLMLFFLVGVASAMVLIGTGYVLSVFLGPAYPGFFEMLLKGLIALPLVFVGYFFNMYLLCHKSYQQYLVNTFAAAGITLVVLLFLKERISAPNAIFLYVVSQLIASLIVPVTFFRKIREIIWQTFSTVRKTGLAKELRSIASISTH